jgi:hypothetical protein
VKDLLCWLFNITPEGDAPTPTPPTPVPLQVGQTWLGDKALCPFPEAMDLDGRQTIGFWTATIKEIKDGWVRSTLAWPKGKQDAKTEKDFRILYPHLKQP